MKSKLDENTKAFEIIVAVTANLRGVGFEISTSVTLPGKNIIRVQITSCNNNPDMSKRITNAVLTEQMKAFRQAIVDLQGAGLWAAASLTLDYNSALRITISADNTPRSGDNINSVQAIPTSAFAPVLTPVAVDPHI